jgi:hypothetical protein
MENNYRENFEKSLETLEDIQYLSSFSLAPLIGRAYYHMSEMKRKADAANVGVAANYDAVSQVLDKNLETIIEDFFINSGRYKGMNYSKSTAKIDLKKWNLILESLPEILSVVAVLSFHGIIDVDLTENHFSVTGNMLEDTQLEVNRKFIYIVTRKLLRRKILMTFQCEKAPRTGLYKLNLKVDISHDDSLIYRLPFKPNNKQNFLVGFSNVLANYRVQFDQISKVGKHQIIEVSNDLSVRNYIGIPNLSRIESANKEILHFSFLFRPISIILPMKGILSLDTLFRETNTLATEEEDSTHDVAISYRTIDFFSLFNT